MLGVERKERPWYTNIPKYLHNKLMGRQLSLPIASYIELDASDPDNYYVRFKDGKSQWVGPDSMTEAIYESDSSEDVVCFASDGGWYGHNPSNLQYGC